MSLPVLLDPEAQAEFDESYDFYEGQRPGLGEQFARRIQDVLIRIGKAPKARSLIYKAVRKAVVIRFPFCVFYREEATCVRVLAVFHSSRNPKEWQKRV